MATTKKTTVKKSGLLSVGEKAPAFSVQNQEGEVVQLSKLRGQRVVLYFYPKDDTPGCTREACDFRDSLARLKRLDSVVLGVSKDSVASHLKFQQKYQLPFSLLADVDGKICEAYGVWQEKKNYGKTYMGIVRTTYVIGADGKIEAVFPKVRVDGHVDAVLSALK